MNMFNGMFGKIGSGMCRLSMSGEIAVKTSSGYKTYNPKTNRLTNCDNFVFDIGEEFFFVIPTNKVEAGDIILVGGKPKCVINVEKDIIKVIDYEDSSVKDILPERHVFMGNTYFYGKIVSMFGKVNGGGTKNMMKYMLMSQMMKGGSGANNSFANMLPMMMLMKDGDNMFDEMFDFVDEEENTKEE